MRRETVITTSGIGAFLLRLARRVWFRAALFTLAAVVLALGAGFIGALIPFELVIDLGQDAVGSILEIIASSMLAVTTFSITAMVTAYSSATTTATPRATQLLIADPTSQNVLSTFVGSFAFSLVGIVALSTPYYTEQGRTILFLGSLVVIALIVITLLRWIAHLAEFGRMADVIDRVEDAAAAGLRSFATTPTLRAARLTEVPASAETVCSESTGYVTTLDVARLNRVAEMEGVTVYVDAMPGRFVDSATALVSVEGRVTDEVRSEVQAAYGIGRHRNYEQDPRLGVVALAEIGSRALSPATNDPGTAIEVIAALRRVLGMAMTIDPDPAVDFPAVRVRPVELVDLLEDAIRPIARDGAAVLEVGIRLQKSLSALARLAPDHAPLMRAAADAAAERALAALDDVDADRLREVRRQF